MEVTGYEFTSFIQDTINDRAYKSKWFLPHNTWKVMNQEHRKIWADLYEEARVCSTSSGIPIFHKKDTKSGNYGGTSCKKGNSASMKRQDNHTAQDKDDYCIFKDFKEKNYDPPEESNLTSFEENNYTENQKRWPPDIRWVNCSKTSYIVLSVFKKSLCFSINLKTDVKRKPMEDGCAETSVISIGNGFVEVFCNPPKVPLVIFDDDISKKYIPIGSAATATDLPNGTIIAQLNDTELLHGGENFLISTEQDREFGVAIQNVDKSHGGKQYIHYDNQVFTMKFDKDLVYVPIQESTQWELENFDRVMFTSDHLLDSAFINDAL